MENRDQTMPEPDLSGLAESEKIILKVAQDMLDRLPAGNGMMPHLEAEALICAVAIWIERTHGFCDTHMLIETAKIMQGIACALGLPGVPVFTTPPNDPGAQLAAMEPAGSA